MRKFLMISLLALPALPAAAQDATSSPTGAPENRCFYASKSFTIGSSIRIGDNVFLCSGKVSASEWVKTAPDTKVNCLYKDSYYAPGSIESFASAKIVMRCNADGTWSRLNTSAGGRDI